MVVIGAAQSHALRDKVAHGCDGIKPGWVRVNFNYFISGTVCDYLIDAADLLAAHGYRLIGDYRFDPRTGLWRHRDGPAEPPLRLADVRFGASGELIYPRRHTRAGEEALAGYLAKARELMTSRPDVLDDGPTGLPAGFESLRWFRLPPQCLPDGNAC